MMSLLTEYYCLNNHRTLMEVEVHKCRFCSEEKGTAQKHHEQQTAENFHQDIKYYQTDKTG